MRALNYSPVQTTESRRSQGWADAAFSPAQVSSSHSSRSQGLCPVQAGWGPWGGMWSDGIGFL